MSKPPDSKKLKVWHTVEAALKDGSLTKPNVCDKCKKPEKSKGGNALQAHHEDYDKPFNIDWLCKQCHMELHNGTGGKKDNTTLLLKVSLRKNLLKEIENPVVMETHGGEGQVFLHCYNNIKQGVVFEKKPEKTIILAKQRPGWFVYEVDCINAINAGVGKHLPINFLDVDPYGEPWPVINSFFENGFYLPKKLCVAVNDGLRQKLKMNGGWTVKSLRKKVEEYGNKDMYENYLKICRELLTEISRPHGYKITKWAGYYCGSAKHMTHYAAVLER
jgi:hypothetical protein